MVIVLVVYEVLPVSVSVVTVDGIEIVELVNFGGGLGGSSVELTTVTMIPVEEDEGGGSGAVPLVDESGGGAVLFDVESGGGAVPLDVGGGGGAVPFDIGGESGAVPWEDRGGGAVPLDD